MSLTSPSSLPGRLQSEWTTRWGPRLLQLPDGRLATADWWLTAVRSTAGPDQDVLLRLLLEASAGGEQAAERLLWKLLIPPVDRAVPARVFTHHERRDRPGIVAAAVWETIRCSPPKVAGRHVFLALVRDATGRLTRSSRTDPPTDPVDPDLLADLAGPAPTHTVPAEIRLAHLFADAVRAGAVTADELGLLRRTLLGDRTVAQVAADLDVTPGTLRKRVQRITRRLGDAAGASA